MPAEIEVTVRGNALEDVTEQVEALAKALAAKGGAPAQAAPNDKNEAPKITREQEKLEKEPDISKEFRDAKKAFERYKALPEALRKAFNSYLPEDDAFHFALRGAQEGNILLYFADLKKWCLSDHDEQKRLFDESKQDLLDILECLIALYNLSQNRDGARTSKWQLYKANKGNKYREDRHQKDYKASDSGEGTITDLLLPGIEYADSHAVVAENAKALVVQKA